MNDNAGPSERPNEWRELTGVGSASDFRDEHARFECRVDAEIDRERARREALRRLQAENAPPLRLLNIEEFLSSYRPTPLVPGMLYRDSLARIYGAPGSAKSFLALDIALSIAAGRFQGGSKFDQSPVVYVMAEGYSVNAARANAWISKNCVDSEDLREHFITIPEAVVLTEAASRSFVREVERVQPALVVLDTKNAMMFGDENSASDFAVLRRVLDKIRKASGCCVLLVDHTGHEGTRARGSSAANAAMDTEIRVTKDDNENPARVVAEVTKDRTDAPGAKWTWRLVPVIPAAVLEPVSDTKVTGRKESAEAADASWRLTTQDPPLPPLITNRPDGSGKQYLTLLSAYMRYETSFEQDPSRNGRTFIDAVRAITPDGGDKNTWRVGLHRAWSILQDRQLLTLTHFEFAHIVDAKELPASTNDRGAAHVWTGPARVSK